MSMTPLLDALMEAERDHDRAEAERQERLDDARMEAAISAFMDTLHPELGDDLWGELHCEANVLDVLTDGPNFGAYAELVLEGVSLVIGTCESTEGPAWRIDAGYGEHGHPARSVLAYAVRTPEQENATLRRTVVRLLARLPLDAIGA